MDASLREKLDILVARRQHHAGIQKDAEKQVEKITTEIKDLLAEAGLQEADLDRFTVSLAVQARSVIRADLLVAAGVSPETIQAATVETPFTRLTVREKKQAE